MLIFSALQATAVAAPVGDPVPLRQEGLMVVGARLSAETLWEADTDCSTEEDPDSNCTGSWKRSGYVASGRLVIANGFAIDGEIGWSNDTLRQADFSGGGLTTAVGLRGALPMGQTGWWLSGVGRYERGLNRFEDTDTYQESFYRLGTVSGLVAWRDDNISAWGGAQGAWMWDHSISQRASTDADPSYTVDLSAGFPVSGLFGMEVISEPLGPGWGPDWRLSIGFEGSLGLSQAAHFYVTVRY